MTTRIADAVEDAPWFEAEGVRIEPANWHWYPHRFAGAVFSADFEEVQRLLPSPPLFPVRISRNRALVFAWGAHIPAVGHEPPFFGFGEVALFAYVTCGEEAAPPSVPMLGSRAMTHYGFGGYMLMLVVTNRVAAQLYRTLCGVPATVADLRVERRPDTERFVCTSDEDLIWDLTVCVDGRPTVDDSEAAASYYSYEDGELYRVPVGGAGVSRCRYGRKAASLTLGHHPLAEQTARLRLSRSWAAEFNPDRHFWVAGPPERVGESRLEVPHPPIPEKVSGRLVVNPTPGVEYEFDQGLDSLGFNPAATFVGSSLADRAV
jgi:hypothetical protein